jgi:hypothetical protein
MKAQKLICGALIGSLSLSLAPLTGCENLPGDEKTQGAVIGGAGGAIAGAAIAKDNRLLGGLIGGALGAAGGYVVGAQIEKNNDKHKDEAVQASERDRKNPPTSSEVKRARTADLNDDGFVTLNEVAAMHDARLSNREMINRLEDTGQVFYLSEAQEEYLRDKGVSDEVIRAMRTMNRDRSRTASDRDDRDRDLDRSR